MRRTLIVAVAAALFAAAGPQASAATDPYRSRQWALDRVQADKAWTVSKGAGVTIAIVDTGIDLDHPDLKSKIVAHYSCIGGTCKTGGDDDNGHGSHVAGIAAAATGNGIGVAGVAPAAKLMAVKVLDGKGEGACSDITLGIRWAADHGADVINLSLGPEIIGLGLVCVRPFQDAAEYAWNKGVVVVIAAGNDGLFSLYSSNALIVVGATGSDDQPAPYSNSGADIYAPGGDSGSDGCTPKTCVFSTWKGGAYASEQGTSMATPHVSGIAALLLARGYKPSQILSRLQSTADPVNGVRRANASRAVGTAAKSTPKSRPSAASQRGSSRSSGGDSPVVLGNMTTPGSASPSALAYGPTATAMPTAAINPGPTVLASDATPGRATRRVLIGVGTLLVAACMGALWFYGGWREERLEERL